MVCASSCAVIRQTSSACRAWQPTLHDQPDGAVQAGASGLFEVLQLSTQRLLAGLKVALQEVQGPDPCRSII